MKRTIKLTMEIEVDEAVLETLPTGKDIAEQIALDFLEATGLEGKVTLETEYDE